jgi:lycopene cyclase domain-containing protein
MNVVMPAKDKNWIKWLPLTGMALITCLFLITTQEAAFLAFDVNSTGSVAWMESSMLYMITLLGSVLFPFLLSFDRKVHFYTYWPALAKAVVAPAAIFLIWDVVFTAQGIWGFNPTYYLGFTLAGLPIEEWMFFFIIPYCCVFIYECLRAYFRFTFSEIKLRLLYLILSVVFFAVALVFITNAYTALTFFLASFFSLYAWRYASSTFLRYFILTWLISLIPFFTVNGILTGMFTQDPVVLYSPDGIAGLRLFTIPVEDAIYLWDYLFAILWLLEIFKKKQPEGN